MLEATLQAFRGEPMSFRTDLSRRGFLVTSASLPAFSALQTIALGQANAAPSGSDLLRPRRRIMATASDGVRIAIQEWGNASGPELLLVHGGMQSHLCWQRQLTGALAGCRIVTLDLRGHGESDKPS